MTATTERYVLDLDAEALRDSAKFQVILPKSGQVIGTITAAGPVHPKVIAHDDAVWMEDRSALSAYQAIKESRGVGSPLPEPVHPSASMTPAKLRERLYRRLAVHVLDADFSIKLNGEVAEFGTNTAFQVFSNPNFIWLAEAFRLFIGEDSNFLPGAPRDETNETVTAE